MAKAFIALGLEPRKSVGILGFNSPEWFFSDLAAIFCNAISVGIYTTNSPDACKYMADHSNANILVVEDANQLKKILEIKDDLKDLKAIVQYTGTPEHPGVLSWQELMNKGKEASDEALEERLKQIVINQCCHLVYTSGTTGPPKAAMLSHDNLTFTAKVLKHTIRKVKFLSKNSILTNPQHFDEFSTQFLCDDFSREIKIVNS